MGTIRSDSITRLSRQSNDIDTDRPLANNTGRSESFSSIDGWPFKKKSHGSYRVGDTTDCIPELRSWRRVRRLPGNPAMAAVSVISTGQLA